jgi:MFS family permease
MWRRQPTAKQQQEQTIPAVDYPVHFLLIARMGHFLGFFGWGIIAMLFPRLGRSLGWSDPAIAYVIAFLMIGQSAGILLANASPWWRGKLWPQFAAQGLMLLCAIVISITSVPVVFESAFVILGIVISVAYTAALYHGMSARKALGKNTGIHESLIAAGNISGCLIGGIAARMTHSLRAPYVAFACMAGACVAIAIVISCKTLIRRS